MPTLRWNIKTWSTDLAIWRKKHPKQAYGDQWGDPEQVPELRKVAEEWLKPFVRKEAIALEVGSGGGRWTQYMLDFRRLYCVDINPEMFPYLLDRFGARPNLSYYLTQGTDLDEVEAGSVDFIFSFGTFVHLDPEIIEGYLSSFRSCLKSDGDVVIQYADKDKPLAAENEGFAHTTGPIMEDMLTRHGYQVVQHGTDVLPHSNIVHARLA